MTALLRVLHFVLAIGTPSETNFVRLVEVLCAVVVTVNLAAAWTHDPEPVTEDVSWLCWSSHLNCQALADEARTQAIEALEVTP
jgi:hypothetical protein